ncbi:host range and adsorption protein [Pseudomonas phage vB_PpuP-Mudajogi]|uniref:Host range and adsorption protein n=1 Tax=Pseudomonas phage vB_PpuP-Mudajogi TaxID=3132683 RepID=A0AAX4NBU2_9CAUD
MGKKIKKAVKSVTKSVSKVAGVASGGLLGGGNDEPKVVEQPAAAVQATPAPTPVAASVVEAPKDDTDGSDDSDTEAAKKAARAKGKRGLQVARSAGSGLNI